MTSRRCTYKIPVGAAYTSCDGDHSRDVHNDDGMRSWGSGLAFAIALLRAEMRENQPGDRLPEIEKALLGMLRVVAPEVEGQLNTITETETQ